MRKKIWGLAAMLHAATGYAADKPVIAPPADWVKPIPVPADNAPADGAAIRILSNDIQLRFTDHGDSTYTENVVRIQTPQGLAAMGTFAVGWKPETDVLTVHKLQIRRGSQIIDVLANGQQFTILRRENGLEYAALNGILTATIQPEGLIVGDIVDFAYTLDRSDPILKGHSDQILASWPQLPIGQIHVSAEWPKAKPIHVRTVDSPAAPTIANGSFAMTAIKVEPLVLPKGAPLRFQIGRQAEFSDYASWAELSAIFAPLFDTARTLHAGSPLKAEIARIKAGSPDPARQVEAALALVQDQVRYLFLGLNDGNLRPAEADSTWLRRYGDCKAKTALLLALLDGLGIPAEAALISTRAGDGLNERLPMMSVFDHVIVRATINGKIYWLDGTRTGDRSIARLKVPGFRWALPVRRSGAKLEPLVVAPLDEPEALTNIQLDATGGITQPAKVHVETTFTGDGAIFLHNSLANLRGADLDRALRAYWAREYDFMTPTSVSVRFNEANGTQHLLMDGTAKLDWNISDSSAYYEIDGSRVGWRPDFTRETGLHEDAPFAVVFPDFTVSRETILLPNSGRGFTIDGADVDTDLSGFHFLRKTKISGNMVTMEASRRSTTSEISPAVAAASVSTLRELSKRSVYVEVPKTYQRTDQENAEVLSQKPVTADDYGQRAGALLMQGKTLEAVEALDHAITQKPNVAEAYAVRASMHIELGHRELAQADVDHALALDRNNATALAIKALLLRDQDAKASLAALSTSISAHPDNSALLSKRGEIYRSIGDNDKALADAREAVRLDPANFEAYLIIANILRERGKMDESAAVADAIIRSNADVPEAYVYAGAIQCGTSHKAEGVRNFDRAIAIHPEQSAFLTRSNCRAPDDFANRRADINAALKLMPNSVDALDMLSELQRGQKAYSDAVATMQRVVAIDPINQNNRIALGTAYALNDQTDLARQTLAAVRLKAARDGGLFTQLCHDVARANFELENTLADCEAARTLRPNTAAAFYNEAFVLFRLKRYSDAVAAYNEALKLRPYDAFALYGRGLTLKRAQGNDTGEADMRAARAIDEWIETKFAFYEM